MLLDLVVDQSEQRRDDQRQPAAHHGRDQVAQRFPPAGRHDDHGVPTVERRVDRIALVVPERVRLAAEQFWKTERWDHPVSTIQKPPGGACPTAMMVKATLKGSGSASDLRIGVPKPFLCS